MANATREGKAAVGTFYVYLAFLICYQARDTGLSTLPSTVLRNFGQYVTTLVYLNSSLNPLIYSWKMSRIRQAIMEILRNILGTVQYLSGGGAEKLEGGGIT